MAACVGGCLDGRQHKLFSSSLEREKNTPRATETTGWASRGYLIKPRWLLRAGSFVSFASAELMWHFRRGRIPVANNICPDVAVPAAVYSLGISWPGLKDAQGWLGWDSG